MTSPHPVITAPRVIGEFAGQPMHAWTEVYADGSVHTYEERVTTVFSPALGRDIGLTAVHETTAAT